MQDNTQRHCALISSVVLPPMGGERVESRVTESECQVFVAIWGLLHAEGKDLIHDTSDFIVAISAIFQSAQYTNNVLFLQPSRFLHSDIACVTAVTRTHVTRTTLLPYLRNRGQ